MGKNTCNHFRVVKQRDKILWMMVTSQMRFRIKNSYRNIGKLGERAYWD
jgi:hypothetical protein